MFKNFSVGGTRKLQFRAEVFNFPNYANLGGTGATTGAQTAQLSGNLGYADPTSGSFGRITRKTDDRRDIHSV